MRTEKGRLKPTIAALAATFAVAAAMLVSVPTSASAAVTTQACAAPRALSAAEQVTLKKRIGKFNSQKLVPELLCLTTSGSNPKPGGELKASLKPYYKGTEVSRPAITWIDSSGKWIANSAATADGNGGWNASLRLTDAHSGKQIRAQLAGLDAYLTIREEKFFPNVWDDSCIKETKNDPDIPKEFCIIDPAHKETIIDELRVGNGLSTTLAQSVAFNPVVVAKPTITGEPLVGNTLSAKLSGTSKAQKVSYQWLRNGAAVKGATAAKYKIQDADLGKQISLKLTGTSPSQKTVVQTSPKTAKVLRKLNVPARGVALPNNRIDCPMWNCTAKMSVQSGNNKGATVKYQWYRNGKAIKGATKATYNVSYQYSKTLKFNVKYTAKVTVTKANYKTVTQSSERMLPN